MLLSQCPDCLTDFVFQEKCYGHCGDWENYLMEQKIAQLDLDIKALQMKLNQ